MESSKLMLGNKVDFYVDSLDTTYTNGVVTQINSTNIWVNGVKIPIEYIRAVDLTEELLVDKLGFKPSKYIGFKGCYVNPFFDKYVIQKMQNKWTIFVDCGTNLELLTGFDYVHQLQNLILYLTGEELIIKE